MNSDSSYPKVKNPFTLSELNELARHVMYSDWEGTVDWTRRATKHYESMKQSLYNLVEEMDYGDDVEEHWRRRICEILQNYDSSPTTIIDKDAKAREVREKIIERDYEILKQLDDDPKES